MYNILKKTSPPTYHAVGDDTCDDEKCTKVTERPAWSRYYMSALPWMISTAVFMSLSIWLHQKKTYCGHAAGDLGSYEHGFATDFKSAIPMIELEQRPFTSGFGLDAEGHTTLPHMSTLYSGAPKPEIDWAWHDLIGGRYFIVSKEEAISIFGDRYEETWSDEGGGYYSGVGMFHELHCLNVIRQSMSPEYYVDEMAEPGWKTHAWHCVDQLRETLMCMGDLTPAPWRVLINGTKHAGLVDSDNTRTCRSFDKIRAWFWERFNGSLALPSSHRNDSLERARKSFQKFGHMAHP